jgi:AraC-like DNA-binding protein
MGRSGFIQADDTFLSSGSWLFLLHALKPRSQALNLVSTMRFCRHFPSPPVGLFVDFFWYYDSCFPDHAVENCLPDGAFELIINLQEQPRKLFDREDYGRYRTFRRAWLSGTHSGYIVIDAQPASSMMGVHFKPGGASAFVPLPAGELRDQVVDLDHVWGTAAWDWRERLLAAPHPSAKFRLLEQFLLERLRAVKSSPERRRRVNWALGRFDRENGIESIGAVVEELGVSHKHFIEEFRREVGLTPKMFCRIRRFQDVLALINHGKDVEWADVACACGYFDQAHFINDFKVFAGVNPSAYLSHNLEYPNFVPVD